MGVWDLYQHRSETHGLMRHDTTFSRGVRTLSRKIPDSLSYHSAVIYDQEHGCNITQYDINEERLRRDVAIINTDNLDEKFIYSLPGEDIECGSLVYWMDNYWIVTERDANTTLYTRAKMVQCNYLLRWVSKEDEVCEQWCVIEDGTKYLTGEYEDRSFVVTRGDSRIAMTIARNKYTLEFGRENRFLIDDMESDNLLAYTLSKPLKVGHTHNGKGVYIFVLQEVNEASAWDNHELRIADYYRHFPKNTTIDKDENVEHPADQRKVWI